MLSYKTLRLSMIPILIVLFTQLNHAGTFSISYYKLDDLHTDDPKATPEENKYFKCLNLCLLQCIKYYEKSDLYNYNEYILMKKIQHNGGCKKWYNNQKSIRESTEYKLNRIPYYLKYLKLFVIRQGISITPQGQHNKKVLSNVYVYESKKAVVYVFFDEEETYQQIKNNLEIVRDPSYTPDYFLRYFSTVGPSPVIKGLINCTCPDDDCSDE